MLTKLPRAGRGRRRTNDLAPAILSAARSLVLAGGPDAVSARKIATRVGCSATAIYIHYRNLDDLLHHLRMEGHGRLARYLRGAAPEAPPIERLLAMHRAYWRFGVENPSDYQLMFLTRFKTAPRREFVQREIFTLLIARDVVVAGVADGSIRGDIDPMVIANAVWASVHGVTSLAVSGLLPATAPGDEDEVLASVVGAIQRWLRPEEVDAVHRPPAPRARRAAGGGR